MAILPVNHKPGGSWKIEIVSIKTPMKNGEFRPELADTTETINARNAFAGKHTRMVLTAIARERARQRKMKEERGDAFHDCADPEVPLHLKCPVLGEEYGEACKEMNEFTYTGKLNKKALLAELVQVAAVAVAIAESLLINEKHQEKLLRHG